MHKLKIGSIPIPTIYIAENQAEAKKARAAGIPYLVRPNDMADEKIAMYVLYTTLQSKFPHIDWYDMLGFDYNERLELIVHVPGEKDCPVEECGDDLSDLSIVDIAEDEREFTGGLEGDDYGERPLESYAGNMSAYVTIEELQDLNLLPTFLDDIADAVKKNLYGMAWSEGYNKKRGVPLGNFDSTSEKPNLMILDVSGSIPRGVSATMLTLIDTMRTQANADLIVTGSCSMYWPAGSELPSPQWIRNHIGYGNERKQFFQILKEHVAGRQWGNLICFGDDDYPGAFGGISEGPREITHKELEGTTVEHLMSFHTERKKTPGYARWCTETPGILIGTEDINRNWVRFMV